MRIATCFLLAFSIAAAAPGDDWTRFRGDDVLGVTTQGRLPERWDSADYRWVVPMAGVNVGSPIIVSKTPGVSPRVYVTDASETGKTLELIAIDLPTGRVLWRHSRSLVDRPRHARNSAAATTPTADRDHVYVAHGDADGAVLLAVTHDGALAWQRDLGSWEGSHGFASSPIVAGDKVILFNSQQAEMLEPGQSPGQSRMIAVDRMTGQDVWSTPLTTTRVCYGVPRYLPRENGGSLLIAANTGNGMFALDAGTGQMKWSLGVFDKRSCSSPVVVDAPGIGWVAIGTSGSGGGGNVLSGVRIPDDDGQPEEVFRITTGAPYVPTPAVAGSRMFLIADNGIATCVDLSDAANKIWSNRLGGNFGASPIIVGDRLLAISLRGEACVLSTTDRGKILGRFSIGESVGATPAVSAAMLVIRVDDRLACLSLEETL